MDEFGFIARFLSPLAAKENGAFGLTDDAAVIDVPAGQQLVLTKDALVEGVHFIGDEPPADIARKALRVNLSDLAAMGATPRAYMLALMLPAFADEQWLRDFTVGLQMDQGEFGISLIGGDTTRTLGSLALSVTMFGFVPAGMALRRSGARAGDDIYVSGTIGDAALGLSVAKYELTGDFLLNRYRLPQPRVALGAHLRGIVSSCTDISDGLAQDLGHICEQSQVGAAIEWSAVPLSDAARASGAVAAQTILGGGDDYELLFTASPENAHKLQALAAITPITRIGNITGGSGVHVFDAQGAEITLAHKGYKHF